ncbi:MAG: TrkH family potassium uptake protein, partial [Victivallales bacterium]|nr:TrkH family potassium uptake protein [Victivallales bacterium]
SSVPSAAVRPCYGILFWRAMLNWLGGVGIVFFVLLLLPMLNLGQSKMLYNAEVPGLKTTADQTTPHLATSVIWVLVAYGGLTMAAIVCYHIFGMTWFDAICHAFSTISTGGFSPRVDGLAHYNHLPALQWFVILFMFLSACNFSLHIQRFSSLRSVYWKDEEFRIFSLVTIVATLFVALMLWWTKCPRSELFLNGPVGNALASMEEYLRGAAFQVVTVLSTTGFCNGNWETWGVPSVLILIAFLMIPCGCGGSTAGGLKWSRMVVLFKQLSLEIRRCLSPRMVQDVRLNNERLDSGLVGKTLAFAVLYGVVIVVVAFLLGVFEPMADNVSTAFGAAITSLSNVGPGFGAVNPAGNFADFNAFSKLLLALTMIIGRLELFTIIVIFLPSTWKK